VHRIRVVSPGMFWDRRRWSLSVPAQRKAGQVPGRLSCPSGLRHGRPEPDAAGLSLGLGSCVIRSTNLEAVRLILKAPSTSSRSCWSSWAIRRASPCSVPGPRGGHWQNTGTRRLEVGEPGPMGEELDRGLYELLGYLLTARGLLRSRGSTGRCAWRRPPGCARAGRRRPRWRRRPPAAGRDRRRQVHRHVRPPAFQRTWTRPFAITRAAWPEPEPQKPRYDLKASR
jgi:hypothetical protein